ncbi:hypothetical protein [Lentzea sp. NPDC055074]
MSPWISRAALGSAATNGTAEAGLHGGVGALIGLAIGVPHAWLAIISLGVEWPLQVPLGPSAWSCRPWPRSPRARGCCPPAVRLG